MKYPTMEQVEKATKVELARWYRFLKSPGWDATNLQKEAFEKSLEDQARIVNRIVERFSDLGGFTPALSKQIGWEEK